MYRMICVHGGRGLRGNQLLRIGRQIYYVAIAAETKRRRSRSVTRFPAALRAHFRPIGRPACWRDVAAEPTRRIVLCRAPLGTGVAELRYSPGQGNGGVMSG